MGFNLGIEMLFISRGDPSQSTGTITYSINVSISESRCFSFQVDADLVRFSQVQSRNRDAFPQSADRCIVFQSRNRDAFHFKVIDRPVPNRICCVSISESRCFSFQDRLCLSVTASFNLGIEMLFISSTLCVFISFDSIFSFNLGIEMLFISSGSKGCERRTS